MSISRRSILRIVPIAAAGFMTGRMPINNIRASTSLSSKEYSGSSLNGWEIALGDALYARSGESPVALDDIETVHHLTSPERSYTELFANVNRRVIMAHNITFYRIIDNAAFQYIHTCGYRFRLPYSSQADVDAEINGQTIEGGIFVWDGSRSQLDYGMAFQWIVNPWMAGELNIWTGSEWQHVGNLDLADDAQQWHEVEMIVDYPRQATTLLIDKTQYQSLFTATSKSGWGIETAARLQAEVISIYPEPAGIKAVHKAQFKDWYWSWEPVPSKVYLPLIIKPEPPTSTPTPTATSTPTPTPTATSTPKPTPSSCNDAYFTYPVANQSVSSPFNVRWVPDTCIMVLQAYQGGHLIYENKNATSGIQIGIPAGRTELKIWVPGGYWPVQNIWINVI